MLFVSERSWKHHYVTLLLPYTYLIYRVGRGAACRRGPGSVLGAAAGRSRRCLMATTSSELGGLFATGQGHKIAQGYGMFLWAGVVLYVATAWRVRAEGRIRPGRDRPGLAEPRLGRACTARTAPTGRRSGPSRLGIATRPVDLDDRSIRIETHPRIGSSGSPPLVGAVSVSQLEWPRRAP